MAERRHDREKEPELVWAVGRANDKRLWVPAIVSCSPGAQLHLELSKQKEAAVLPSGLQVTIPTEGILAKGNELVRGACVEKNCRRRLAVHRVARSSVKGNA